MQNEEETFEQFEEEFNALTQSLARKLDAVGTITDSAAAGALLQEAEADVMDAKTCMNNIELELRHWPYSVKSKCQARLRKLKQDFDRQQRSLKDAEPGNETAMPGGMSKSDQKRWKDQRKRLLNTKSVVDSTSLQLDRTAQKLNETTDIGSETTLALRAQTEQMRRARETIRETDSLLVKSRKTLRRMSRRVITNKLIQAMIILLELAIIVLIVLNRCS